MAVIELTDPKWNELGGNYGNGTQLAELIAKAMAGAPLEECYEDLFQRLCHQEAINQAARLASIRWNQVAGVGVGAGEGILELLEVQLAGKSAMDVHAFGQGRRDFAGSLLGGPSS